MSETPVIHKDSLQFFEEFGQGHHSGICRAIDQEGKEIAVKYCKRDPDSLQNKATLEREVRVLSKISHDNIVRVYGTVCDRDRDFVGVAFEYMPCGDLSRAIEKLKGARYNLPWCLKIRFMYQIACTMSYMHQQNIVHNHITASNIALTPDLQSKLMNFGLSIQNGSKSNSEEFAYATVTHVAPELLNDYSLFNQYHEERDVFSFGVTMFEIMAESKPYDDNVMRNTALLMHRLERGTRPDATQIQMSALEYETYKGKVDSTLIPLMKQCWDQDPKKRPSAHDIAVTLGDLYKTEEMAAKVAAAECARIVSVSDA